MTKVIEIIFRNKARLFALLLAPVLVSGVIVFLQPRSYQATARLYALRRYTIIGATGTESDLQSTPAVTQATALNEFLQTEVFDLAVAKGSDLAKSLGVPLSDTQRLNDAIYTEISTHVSVTATSTNLFVITYTNKDPVLAMQVVKSVITQYGEQSAIHATAEGEQLLTSYQGQLLAAQQQADSATKAAAQYYNNHGLTATTASGDSQYQLLYNAQQQAIAARDNIQSKVTDLSNQLIALSTGAQGLFQTMDPPTVPLKPESRTKTLLVGGGVGLAIGLLAVVCYFIILVRLDQSVYSSADMPTVTDYPVLIQIQRLPRRSATWITRPSSKLIADKG
ncbi:MAG TPA: hypothetical protein VJR48_06785, partial [Ktedonobacterales bacterium]|nr:hypothetical protein [Ktedonobacterales bacterium]